MDLKNIEIILIEDSPSDALFTTLALAKHGLSQNIIHLIDGAQALEFFFNSKPFKERIFSNDKTKIVLLDIHMPRIDGIEVLEKLKCDPKTKNIPVVILTSSDHDPVIQKCKELGAADYIIKPVTMEGFVKVINGLASYWTENK